MARLHIDAKADHLLRLAHRTEPVAAVIELVWNSLDAEAQYVDVRLERTATDAIESVRVIDDGHGLTPESVASAFEHLGGSWKVAARVSPNLKRPMNGRKGQGRIRGFALGNTVSWTTIADDTAGARQRTIVSARASDPTNPEADNVQAVSDDPTGTTFLAENPAEFVNRLTSDTARPKITAAFAPFLTENPNVSIRFDGSDLDPASAERHRAEYPLTGVISQDDPAPPTLRIIEWKKDAGRAIHLCDTSGAVLETVSPEVRAPGYHFTAYVLWDEFRNRSEDLPLAELQGGDLADLITVVRAKIVEHFHAREAERRAEQVRQWKIDGEYPYRDDPHGEAERAEREVFDYVATTIARKIPKSQVARKTTLGFLREAVASEPSSLPRILDDLFALPRNEHDDIRRLLDRTTMSKLIAANTTIANRLDFLAALRDMVFDPATSKQVKERRELHKILERELWVFGEEYGLLLSDRGLDQVLARHIGTLRPDQKKPRCATSSPVRRADGSRGIVDLMLAQQRKGVNVTENLVVELKRPAVKITNKEAGQIKEYAEAVASDPQFHGFNVRWDFWVISTEIDAVVARDASGNHLPPGMIADWGNGVRVWAKTWSQLIGDCEPRLRHYKEAPQRATRTARR